VGDIVYIKGQRATKTNNGGTPMIVSTYAGIRGGEPLHWSRKWLPVKDFRRHYGKVPKTIVQWEREGLIKCIRFGKRGDRRFAKEEILRLLEGKVDLSK
jgi:hypothetical protein